ncbi:MAG TPA: hypothetical protein VGQ09_05960 [Chitinophagaceae bacterium]|jgi:hypothetical protein|nr:hypothetical protein [Chitinophagaceae bacterium]
MRQHKKKKANIYSPTFKVIWGAKAETKSIDDLVTASWNFAYTALWNTSIFSASEIEQAKTIIKDYLTASKNPEKGYSAFVQRILLTRHYLNNNPNKFVPLPSLWFDRENLNGFAGTKEWYLSMLAVRESLPMYKIELKAFAEAILEMQEDNSSQNFHYWRNYFIERKTPGLLNLFLSTIANQQYEL